MSSAKNGGGSEKWYLRKSDGSEYGPASMDDLARWAAESRVVSGNAVSRDRKEWLPVEEIPELAMSWTAHLADGRKYGPFNILATRDLHRHKVLPADARLVHVTSGEDITVAEWLQRPAAEPGDSRPPAPEDAAGRPQAETNDEAPEEGAPAAAEPKKRRRPRRRPDGTQRELWDAGAAAAEGDAGDAAQEDGAVESAEAGQDPDGSGAETGEDAQTPRETVAPEPAAAGKDSGPVPTALPTPEETDSPDVDATGGTEAAQAALREAEALRERMAALERLHADAAKRLKGSEAARSKAEAELESLRGGIGAAGEAHARALEEAAGQAAAAEDRARQARADRDAVEAARRELEQRLQAVDDEVRAARADEARATAALRGAEAANLRKTQVYEKRIKDLLDERNDLTRLVEKQAAKLKILRLASSACLILAGLALAFGVVMNLRGCSRAAKADAGQSPAGAPAAAPDTRPAAAPKATGRRTALPILNAVPGSRAAYDRTGCAVYFDAGVFSSATTVTPTAMAVLQRLVPQLKPYLAEYDLVVEGYTDNQPLTRDSRYGSNADLAMARARAFARVLSSDFGIPLAAMRAQAGDMSRAPYPNDTETSRARNRTVVLRLVRHAGN